MARSRFKDLGHLRDVVRANPPVLGVHGKLCFPTDFCEVRAPGGACRVRGNPLGDHDAVGRSE
eukprot:5231806-Alexandrium_andersonii.AAC.1